MKSLLKPETIAKQEASGSRSAAACSAWREVTKEEFFRVIGPMDVHPSIQPGKYPYTLIWQTPQRSAIGKSVGHMEGERELTAWYLPDTKPKTKTGCFPA